MNDVDARQTHHTLVQAWDWHELARRIRMITHLRKAFDGLRRPGKEKLRELLLVQDALALS